jgi:SAM-dependent methyltransferase
MESLSIHAWLRWDAVQRLLPESAADVLEIGAGMGGFGAMLAKRFDYVGLEPDQSSYRVASARTGGRVLNEAIEAHEGVYDLVCAFEVLEHLEEDVLALQRWRGHTRRWLLVSVPFDPARFGATDVHAGHFRRYTTKSLSAALSHADFRLTNVLTYGFPAGYVLEAARNAIVSRRATPPDMLERTAASGRWLQPPPAIRLLTWTAALPLRAIQRPFYANGRGTGLVALAEVGQPAPDRSV